MKIDQILFRNWKIYPTTCTQNIAGTIKSPEASKKCKIYEGAIVDKRCQFIPDRVGNTAKASIMFRPNLDSV